MKKRYIIILTTTIVSILFIMVISYYLFVSIFITDFNDIDKIINPMNAKNSITNQEQITIHHNQLQLTGYLTTTSSDVYVLVVHGYGGTGKEMDWATKAFHKMGFNVLAIDLQGNGNSEGDYTTLGTNEQEDIVAWCDYLEDLQAESKIVLYGVSMGATTILNALDDELSKNVKVVIEDSGYTSIEDIFSYHLDKTFSLPSFPILPFNKLYAWLQLGINIQDGPVHTISKNKLPILFIHGTKDTFVPCDNAKKLYEACTSNKELYLIEEAGHVGGNEVDKGYWIKIERFIRDNIVY